MSVAHNLPSMISFGLMRCGCLPHAGAEHVLVFRGLGMGGFFSLDGLYGWLKYISNERMRGGRV